MRTMERAERRGCSRLRASARSRVSGEMARTGRGRERGLGLRPSKPCCLVDAFPAGEGGGADGAAGGVGDVVVAGGDLLPQPLLAAGWVLATQQGQDEGVAKEGDLGASWSAFGHGCLLMMWMVPV